VDIGYKIATSAFEFAKIKQTVRKRGFDGVAGDINRHRDFCLRARSPASSFEKGLLRDVISQTSRM